MTQNLNRFQARHSARPMEFEIRIGADGRLRVENWSIFPLAKFSAPQSASKTRESLHSKFGIWKNISENKSKNI